MDGGGLLQWHATVKVGETAGSGATSSHHITSHHITERRGGMHGHPHCTALRAAPNKSSAVQREGGRGLWHCTRLVMRHATPLLGAAGVPHTGQPSRVCALAFVAVAQVLRLNAAAVGAVSTGGWVGWGMLLPGWLSGRRGHYISMGGMLLQQDFRGCGVACACAGWPYRLDSGHSTLRRASSAVQAFLMCCALPLPILVPFQLSCCAVGHGCPPPPSPRAPPPPQAML